MGEAGMTGRLRDSVELVLGRLSSARWLIAGATVALVGLSATSGATVSAVLLAALFVVAVAAVVPRRDGRPRTERAADARRTPFDAVTAEHLAASVSDPLVICDAHGAVVYANKPAAAAFSALTEGTSLFLRFRAPEMQELIGKLLSQGTGGSIDYAERIPVERWFRVTASPIGQAGGFFVLVFKDQSETRRIDRMRADFIANASHELRTPLASVSGFIETLRGPARNDAAAREQFLQIMQNQTARMARLIDDLLSLSRLETKPFLNPADRLDLRPLIDGVIDALNPMAKESGVRIERDYGDGPAIVAANRDELIQVFENLLENACKYGQSGGRVLVSIDRGASGYEGMIDVAVRDFGPGIPEEHIPRLTERFYRVDVETSRGQKGTGLGLAIVKHILTRHNARLTIRSKSGEGSTFTVHFPRS